MSSFVRIHRTFILKEMPAFITDCHILLFAMACGSITHFVLFHKRKGEVRTQILGVYSQSLCKNSTISRLLGNIGVTSKETDLENNIVYLKL